MNYTSVAKNILVLFFAYTSCFGKFENHVNSIELIQRVEVNHLVNDITKKSSVDEKYKNIKPPVDPKIAKLNKDTVEKYYKIARLLDTVFIDDQKYRILIEDVQNNNLKSVKLDALYEMLHTQDAINLIKVKSIIDRYGWLGSNIIGERGNEVLFLVIQHSDPKTQEKYLPILRQAVRNREANASDLALLEDRLAIGQGKKQIYGSQVVLNERTRKYMLSPVEDEINVNKRRFSVGLGPIEEYVKYWGIIYNPRSEVEKSDTIWKEYSTVLSIFITGLLYTTFLFFFYQKKHWDLFWLLIFFILLFTIEMFLDYFNPRSSIKYLKGDWVLFTSSRTISYCIIIFSINFFLSKLIKIKSSFIDTVIGAVSIFLATLIYNYVLINPVQNLFVPNSGITFYFNILEPLIYLIAYLIIALILFLRSKNRKKK